MKHSSIAVAVALALGAFPGHSKDPEPPGDPQASTESQKGERLASRIESMRRLVDEGIAIGKRLKDDPERGAAGRARLRVLHSELNRMVDEQLDDLIEAGLASDVDGTGDPSDVYFQGWLLSRDAGKLREKGSIIGSRLRLNAALRYFEFVSRRFPDWKPEMVGGRVDATKEALSAITQKEE